LKFDKVGALNYNLIPRRIKKERFMKRWGFAAFFLVVFFLLLTEFYFADEGMWPISEINKLSLKTKGLEISPEKIFSPSDLSLIYAVVQVGATGSFVCLLYTSPSPRDRQKSRMPSSA
jgi:hypothetical protein